MNLENIIEQDLINAIKEKNLEKANTLRLIKTEIMKVKTASGFDANKFNDDSIFKILQKMSKEREESSDIYKSNMRQDLADKELKEKEIIDKYLPKQASEKEVEAIVKSVICELGATSIKDMGKVMKVVSSELGSRSDGKTISTIVKNCLNKNN